MRNSPLTREEKAEVESLLKKLDIAPPAAGQVIFNFDGQGKVANGETAPARMVWR